MQIVRAFLATSILPLIVYSIFLSLIINKYKSYFKFFNLISILLILILSIYHLDLTLRNNPFGINMLIQKKLRFDDNTIKSLYREKWDKFIKSDVENVFNFNRKNYRNEIHLIQNQYFSIKDVKIINEILTSENKIYLYHNLEIFESLHTIFKNNRSSKVDDNLLSKIVRESKNRHKICYISNNKIIRDKKFILKFTTKSKLLLYCNFEEK